MDNGSVLLNIAAQWVFESAGFEVVTTLERAEIIGVVRGLINRNDPYIKVMGSLLRQSPDRPVVILPITYVGESSDQIPTEPGEHCGQVLLYARELRSYEILKGLPLPHSVDVRLDHDIAFNLTTAPFLERLRGTTQSEHILIVERRDSETTTAVPIRPPLSKKLARPIPASAKAHLPHAVKTRIERGLNRFQRSRELRADARTAFASDVQARLGELHEFAGLPVFAADIADEERFSFDEYCRAIANAAVIFTTRLHVGILGALLDKPTYLYPTKSHKVTEVFNYSMGDMSHVALVTV